VDLAAGATEERSGGGGAGVKAEYDKLPTSMPTTFLTVGTQQAQADALRSSSMNRLDTPAYSA
jgi:hypothetical protein